MPPSKKTPCQVCRNQESKYTCAKCMVQYCSVPCYKEHKESSCLVSSDAHKPIALEASSLEDAATKQRDPDYQQIHESSDAPADDSSADVKPPSPPLRPLTTLKWPYVPEESAYPDPLKRDDPKPLQLHQYEAIATSPAVRKALTANARLPELLRSIDQLRGSDREEALQRALGVSASDANASFSSPSSSSSRPNTLASFEAQSDEDVKALRDLAEAIEAAVRGGKQGMLGLDWGD